MEHSVETMKEVETPSGTMVLSVTVDLAELTLEQLNWLVSGINSALEGKIRGGRNDGKHWQVPANVMHIRAFEVVADDAEEVREVLAHEPKKVYRIPTQLELPFK
jgi:hypothetical protein